MMKQYHLFSFFLSMLTLLFTFWTAKYTVYAEGWAQSIAYFALTFMLLNKYESSSSYGIPTVISIILGRIILEIPIRIMDFSGSVFSMFVPIVALVSIILGALYFKERKNLVLILEIIIIILLNTVAHEAWIKFVQH